MPIWTSESLLDYFKMLWAVAAKLSEELCCCLLREPLQTLFRRSSECQPLRMELLKATTTSFIRNHFGERTFSRYYLATTRSALKCGVPSIRAMAEAFLVSMNSLNDQVIESALIDPLLHDLSVGAQLNAEEVRSFMMMTQRRGEVLIAKKVIPKMLRIVDDKVALRMNGGGGGGQVMSLWTAHF